MTIDSIRQNSTALVDLGVLLTVPIVLLAIHASVTKATAANFYFYPWDPSLRNIWTATLFHASWGHVGSNAVTYVFTILPMYAIYYRWNRRRLMWAVIAVTLFSAPPVIGLMEVFVLRELLGTVGPSTNMKGFSGVASAFIGMFWVTIGGYINDRTASKMGSRIGFVAYLLLAMFLAITYQSGLAATAGLVVLCSVGLTIAGWGIYDSVESLSYSHLRRWVETNNQDARLLSGSILVAFLLVVVLFPANLSAGAGTTNIFSHLVGLIWGLVVTIIAINVASGPNPPSSSTPETS